MLYEQIQAAVTYIRQRSQLQPTLGIILGTGLGNLANKLTDVCAIAYTEIPHFPTSTVQGHAGKLLLGLLENKPVAILSGRFHYYEGYSLQQTTFPVRVLKNLGIETLLITNASGSVNPNFEAGDVVFIKDHINLMPDNPLRGANDERLGVRFPDMLYTYHRPYIEACEAIARQLDIHTHQGVYLALQGPNLETPAEYEFAHRIGADLVGMSSVPEAIVARHSNLRVLGISVVSNKCYPIKAIQETTIDDVLAVVQDAAAKMEQIILRFVGEYHKYQF
ncbi:MAG: purine-nucleoside phosphorylase [Saprospiraceae bacterium]|nr:purine-nucleoside phosphorylase [Saprospiraceae bacterium]MBP7679453.1 purine-nucleoside phosphorylase [Saprospiraceae bacterium]